MISARACFCHCCWLDDVVVYRVCPQSAYRRYFRGGSTRGTVPPLLGVWLLYPSL